MDNQIDLISARDAYRILGVTAGKKSEERLVTYGIPVAARVGKGSRPFILVHRKDVEAAKMKLDAEKKADIKRKEEAAKKQAAVKAANAEEKKNRLSPSGIRRIRAAHPTKAKGNWVATPARLAHIQRVQELNRQRMAAGVIVKKGVEHVLISRMKEIEDLIIKLMVDVGELQKELRTMKGEQSS
jgi:hypothetical protein